MYKFTNRIQKEMTLYLKINELLKKGLKFSIEPDFIYPDKNIVELSTFENLIEFRQKYIADDNMEEINLIKLLNRMEEIILFNVKNYNHKTGQ